VPDYIDNKELTHIDGLVALLPFATGHPWHAYLVYLLGNE
jgi:hypothetical protein